MSGATDLARFTTLIDTANELMLTDEIKMMDVGDGVQRPTNAKAISDLATQMAGAMIYTTLADGLAGTVNGSYFSVLSTATEGYVDLYRNNAGAAVLVDTYPNSTALASVAGLVKANDGDAIAHSFEDGFGFVLAQLLKNGTLDLRGGTIAAVGDGFEVADKNGFMLARLGPAESMFNGMYVRRLPSGTGGFEIVDRNGFIMARFGSSVVIPGSAGSGAAAIYPALNAQQRTAVMHVINYGQSLSRGQEAIPSISTTQPYGNIMIASGTKVRYRESGYNAGAFVPLVESTSGAEGETPVTALCNGVVRRAVDSGESAADWVFLGSSPGRGGRAIEELMPGYSSGWFEKMVALVKDCKARADALGKTYSVWAYSWEQGETNYVQDTTWTRSPYQYLQYELSLFDELTRQVQAISGQKFRPYLFSYQVAAHRKYDRDIMGVALAQWRASRERDDVVLSVPAYIFATQASDSLHLTNESSWLMGEYHSRAMYETMIRRNGKWRPLEPISVDWSGSTIDIKFHVPSGSLVLDTALASATPNFGFDVRESGSVITDLITSVTVTSSDTVRLVLSRSAAADAVISYGRGRNGDPLASGPVSGARGNLRDTHGLFDIATSPQGTAYPLHNPCVMFQFDRKTGF